MTPVLDLSFGPWLAVEDGDVRLTYDELKAAAGRAARAFVAVGVAKGDRVAIWAPNIWEWIVAALGVHAAGGVIVTVNTRFKGDEAAYVLRSSGAKLLLTVSGFLGTDYPAMLAGHDLPALQRTVILRGDTPAGCDAWQTFLWREKPGATLPAVRDEDLSDILFTSGTTGRPKGVPITHGQTRRTYQAWCEVVGLRQGDRYLVVAPFFHCFGYKAGWLAALMTGATVLPHAVFDAAQVLRRIGPDRVSVLPGPPALYQSLLAHPERHDHDLSTLRLAVTGAASIPVELIHRMRAPEGLGFDTVITGYGLTECSGVATMCRVGDDPQTIATTSGRALPDVEVRVVDPAGKYAGLPLPPGEPGEVQVRGYNVLSGYWDDPQATAQAVDEDGWLRTGDIGVLDFAGNLRITDRIKDMFIVGGFNAYPAEIEHVLLDHPAIADAAVVGTPDERLGEVGVAYVVADPTTADATPMPPVDELIAWARERMANYKVPRRIEVVDALPRNATGKVLKYVLRARAAS